MGKTKIIFVAGGLFSGIGKGVVSASLANLFKSNGQKVFLQKHDPYLNVDANLMSPYEHGEVFVTADGKACDLDLGTYERFSDQNMTKDSVSTLGKVLFEVLTKERNADFSGKTINFYNVEKHIENDIEKICHQEKPDVVIMEIGGNINDKNVFPYFQMIRNLIRKYGEQNFFFFFLTYLTYFSHTNEFKTRSTQQSIQILRSYNIEPNFVLFRSEKPVPTKIFDKLSQYCYLDVQKMAILPNLDNIYEVPLFLEKTGAFAKILRHFGWKSQIKNDNWKQFITQFNAAQHSSRIVNIAVVNKYVNFPLSYASIFQSCQLAATQLNVQFRYTEISPEKIVDDPKYLATLANYEGILIPGGYDLRGFEGKILAAQYAREHQIPFFGICFGMQASIVAFARYELGMTNAHSKEFFPSSDSEHEFIITFVHHEGVLYKEKIGEYEIMLDANSKTAEYLQKYHTKFKSGEYRIQERRRHRLIFNSKYREKFSKAGYISVGSEKNIPTSTEILELNNHPFYVGVQFHPEFKSRPSQPHFLFLAFFAAILKNHHIKK